MHFKTWFIVVAALLIAGISPASEGVREINQSCAMTTGCFPGDAPGFPINLGSSLSGRNLVLTSDLDVSSMPSPQNVTAIQIITDGITIDLNGFEIRGPGIPGSGRGILSNSAGGITVRNGRIVGMGAEGISLASQNRIESVNAVGNGSDGIAVSGSSTITDCIAYDNGDAGIRASGSVVTRNASHQNAGPGIIARSGSVVLNNTVTGNAGDGIEARFHSTVRGNAIRQNGGLGINVPQGTLSYAENVMEFNSGGTVLLSTRAVEIGENLCNGNTTCP